MWNVTFGDVRMKIRLKAELENVHGLQAYQAVAEVASAAFGGKKSDDKPVFDPSDQPGDMRSAEKRFAELMGGGTGG